LDVPTEEKPMAWIGEIGWDIRTSSAQFAGTDTRVSVEILRDNALVIALLVEPGSTTRLDRGDGAFYWWRFQGANFAPRDSDIGVSHGGAGFPHGVEFPQGVVGHLKCRFRAWGDDMWIKDNIDGYVRYATERGVPGTIDSTVWVDDINWSLIWHFPQDVALSTDASEGFTTWTLNY
jgi:hypothetical protein